MRQNSTGQNSTRQKSATRKQHSDKIARRENSTATEKHCDKTERLHNSTLQERGTETARLAVVLSLILFVRAIIWAHDDQTAAQITPNYYRL